MLSVFLACSGLFGQSGMVAAVLIIWIMLADRQWNVPANFCKLAILPYQHSVGFDDCIRGLLLNGGNHPAIYIK